MKICTSLIILFIGFVHISFSQQVEIVLKNGEKIKETIKANSENQLYLDGSNINYSEIESIKFNSEKDLSEILKERLGNADIKLFVLEHRIFISEGFLNEKPKKGDKKIILTCSDSLQTLYRRIGQYLSTKGYAIENANKDFLTIKTALRNTSQWNVNYFLNVVIINHRVNITAQWKVNNSNLAGTRETGFFDWKYTHDKEGFSMNVNSLLYNDLIKMLSDFERLRISYE